LIFIKEIQVLNQLLRKRLPLLRPSEMNYHSVPTLLAATLFLGGCASIQTEPIAVQDVKSTTTADLALINSDVAPLKGPLSIEEAIARAIKYNVERRVRTMEEALANGQLEVGQYDMLPKLVASAGYHDRDKDLITRSKDSVTGVPSLANPYISSDRHSTTNDLSFTWSLLDFGQSYYASKQNADRAMIAQERRRKATHMVIQDVRAAFWRAASAQKLKTDVQATIFAADDALSDSRKAEAERLRNPLDALRYQRQLLENLRLLEAIDQELSSAKIELSSLVNLPLSQVVAIAEPTGGFGSKWLDTPVEQLEEIAIAQNADLREAHYNTRIAHQETRRVMARMFPGISFNYALRGSDDSYLVNQRWNEAGVQISLNLLNLLSGPAQRRMADAGVNLANQQRMATLMRVMTQVHLARQQLGNSVRLFERADAIANVDNDIAEHAAKREAAQTMTKLDRVANQTSAILSQLRRYQALAQVYAASSKLQATLGMDPVVEGNQTMPLDQLSKKIGIALQQWGENLPVAPRQAKPVLLASATSTLINPPSPQPVLAPAVPVDAKIAVTGALTAWVSAWTQRDTKGYLDAYADNFVPPHGANRSQWASKRSAVIGKAKNVQVDVADLGITVQSPQQATAQFKQIYKASGYRDVVQKTLSWSQVDGHWKIVREVSAPVSPR
jgi:outer membrane protein TolC